MKNWKLNIVNEMKKKMDEGYALTFVHTPKCAGSYAKHYLRDLGIRNRGHTRAVKKRRNKVFFTTIREPVARFESLLNYRLGCFRRDYRNNLRNFYGGNGLTDRRGNQRRVPIGSLNDIVENMTDEQILGFKPYRSLTYWSQGVDLLITIDEFLPTLDLLGFDITRKHARKNVSKKNRGTFSEETKTRVGNLFAKDMELFQHWTRDD